MKNVKHCINVYVIGCVQEQNALCAHLNRKVLHKFQSNLPIADSKAWPKSFNKKNDFMQNVALNVSIQLCYFDIF